MTEEEQSELSTKCVQLKLQAKKSALSKSNSLDYKYIDEKLLEDKKEKKSDEQI